MLFYDILLCNVIAFVSAGVIGEPSLGCTENGVTYRNGDLYTVEENGECKDCRCIPGESICTTGTCLDLECPRELVSKNSSHCCEHCTGCEGLGPGGSMPKVIYDLHTYHIRSDEPCYNCYCESDGLLYCHNICDVDGSNLSNNSVRCSSQVCPNLICPDDMILVTEKRLDFSTGCCDFESCECKECPVLGNRGPNCEIIKGDCCDHVECPDEPTTG